jgi:FkbM family methyltransferase
MRFTSLESLVRRTANHFGIDIRRHRPEASESGRLATMLHHNGVNLVLDVGANVGQFAQSLRRAGYSGRLISFEPLAQAHRRLLAAAEGDPNWKIAPRVAIGDRDGEIEIHVSKNSVSSSILDMLESHLDSAPGSKYIASERVLLATLDTMVRDEINSRVVPFLKIDAQGYEDRVLNGAREVLTRARGIQLELSFLPLYEGQQLFDHLMEHLRTLGFSVWGIWPGFCDPQTGRMLQVDALFFRD